MEQPIAKINFFGQKAFEKDDKFSRKEAGLLIGRRVKVIYFYRTTVNDANLSDSTNYIIMGLVGGEKKYRILVDVDLEFGN